MGWIEPERRGMRDGVLLEAISSVTMSPVGEAPYRAVWPIQSVGYMNTEHTRVISRNLR